jgi:hypothetical protein
VSRKYKIGLPFDHWDGKFASTPRKTFHEAVSRVVSSNPMSSTLYEARKTMSLEQAIDKLTAAIEAATGVLVTLGAVSKATGSTPAPTPAPTPRPPGRPKGSTAAAAAAAAAPTPEPAANEELDESGGLDDDSGLGGDDSGEPGLTAEDAKAAVLAYRDKAIKTLGKEEGLNATRALMKKYVAALDDISADNAAEIHKAFAAALPKLKAK